MFGATKAEFVSANGTQFELNGNHIILLVVILTIFLQGEMALTQEPQKLLRLCL